MLDELRRMLAAATPGPWERTEYYENTIEEHASTYARMLAPGIMDGPNRQWPAVDHVAGDGKTICIAGNGPTSRRNAALIAAAVNALPALLAVADAARELEAATIARDLTNERSSSINAAYHREYAARAALWTALEALRAKGVYDA